MVYKQVRSKKLEQLSGGQMIAYRSKTYSRWDSNRPPHGTKQRCLAHTIATTAAQHIAGLIMFRQIKGIVGIIPNIIAHRIIKTYGLGNLIFTIARPGDNIVTSLNIFGEGYKQAATIFPERCQVDFRFVEDPADPKAWDALIDAKTKLVWVETPSNPCLFVTDIRAVADVCHA